MKRVSEFVLGLTAAGLKRPVNTAPMVQHLVQAAFDRNLVLEVAYRDARGEETVREVEVGPWYADHFRAYCRLRGSWRTFRYAQVRSARWTGEVFEPQAVAA